MQKILVTAGAIAALGYLGYRAMYKGVGDPQANIEEREASAPKQQLDNVRAKARNIEANDQAYTDKIEAETK
jgi:hypothetical protein